MTLTPINEAHALQIQAGTLGRKAGHTFEATIAQEIIGFPYPRAVPALARDHVLTGDPAALLLTYIANKLGIHSILGASAISTGALATSEEGKQWLSVNGVAVSRSKSDLVITLHASEDRTWSVGVSTKQCNNKTPTNAQLYFTTARGFASLLQNNGLPISDAAKRSLRQFCGDVGFRPQDDPAVLKGRLIDPRRFFWEEIDQVGREEWQQLFANHQGAISQLLLQKAYLNDPFVPEYLLHKTRRSTSWINTEVAIYSIEELIALSCAYQGFATRPYSVTKGSHRDPPGVTRLAPRFGVIQMQRGGQKQHPEQLQFNLEGICLACTLAARCIIRKERALPTYAASGTLCDKVLFMPSSITRYLDLLDEQREAIFQELGALPDAVLWYRPGPRVWSIGEHLDHSRVCNCSLRRFMIVYYPLPSVFARLFRHRPYKADIEDLGWVSNYPKGGWIFPPKYTPRRPVSVGFLHEALRAEHAAYRRFYTTHDEQILGHILLADPLIGAVLNLVQWLRIQAYHDAHHYERVRVRIKDREYGRAAAAAGELKE